MASSTSEIDPLKAAREALSGVSTDESGRNAALAYDALTEGDAAAHANAAYLLCMAHFRLGRWATVLACGDATLPLLEAQSLTSRRVEVRRWMTLAACETGRFDLGLTSANESCRLAEAAGEPAQLAMSLVSLAICIERMGDPWQAHRLMEEARTLMEGVDDPYTHGLILNNLCAAYIGAFYLLRDSADVEGVQKVLRLAEGYARQALPLMPGIPGNPFFSAILEGNLAEALVHLGEVDEAERLLHSALNSVNAQGNSTRGFRIRYTMGTLMLARGDAKGASDALEALCSDMAGSEQINTLTRVHEALYRSWRQQNDYLRALEHLERYEALERKRVMAQMQAQSRLFVTRVEAERARLEAQVERLRAAEFEADAQHDQLTGLGNRRHLDKRMPGLFAEAANAGKPVAAALIDLDHFKQVNDRFGHAMGDRVLVQIAELLRANTRNSDVLVRLGGEEFLVVFADTSLSVAQDVCERLRAQVQAHDWTALAPELSVTLSIGLATAPPYDLDTLTESADGALYRAKSGGRNRVMV